MSKHKLDPSAPRPTATPSAEDKKWQKLAQKLGATGARPKVSDRDRDVFEPAKLAQVLAKLLKH